MTVMFKIFLATVLLFSLALAQAPFDSAILGKSFAAFDTCYRPRGDHEIVGKWNSIDYNVMNDIHVPPACREVVSLKFFRRSSTTLPFIEHNVPILNDAKECVDANVFQYRPWTESHPDFIKHVQMIAQGAAKIRDFRCNKDGFLIKEPKGSGPNHAVEKLIGYLHVTAYDFSFSIAKKDI